MVSLGLSWAYEDEAYRAILQTTKSYQQDGFTIRAEYWSGSLETGTHRLIRHQLLRGHEYWFWGATANPKGTILVEVYNEKGNPISLETIPIPRGRSVRVIPPRTAVYYVLVKSTVKHQPTAESLDWALVYGYR